MDISKNALMCEEKQSRIIVPALGNIHMSTSEAADRMIRSYLTTEQVSNLETNGTIFEDYARKSGLKRPQFLAAKYEVVTESSK
ncbi:hypothetical protein Golax_016680, partial [Gossypium laxum]|nr:hypothetical protein [Gossypium laxum]